MSASIEVFSSRDLSEVKEIFFESSVRKTFKDNTEKEAFFFKYLGFYLKHYPELCLVSREDKVLGYVVAAPVTVELELWPHMNLFKSEFENYPAHLHINCHIASRGKGVGSKLITALVQKFIALDIKGLHIVTSPNSENRNFYKRLGFTHEVELNFQGSPLLFMGKTLSENSL